MSLQRVKEFLDQTDSFNKLLDEQLDDNANRLNEKQVDFTKQHQYLYYFISDSLTF